MGLQTEFALREHLTANRLNSSSGVAGNNPQRVMTHLSKCFQAIDRLILDESGARPKGCGIVSCVGIESCQWTSPLLLDGKVEQYMNGIIDKMRSELKSVLLNSVKAYPAKKRTEWLFDWPSQVHHHHLHRVSPFLSFQPHFLLAALSVLHWPCSAQRSPLSRYLVPPPWANSASHPDVLKQWFYNSSSNQWYV